MKKLKYFVKWYLFIILLIIFQSIIIADNVVIKSASEYDYPPFCIVGDDGEAEGFSVDLLRAVLNEMRLNVTFEMGPWSEVKKMLEDGRVQVLPLVGRTPEREEVFDFTIPYHTLHGAIFVKDGTKGINEISDLKEKSVIVMKGDNAEEYAIRNNLTSNLISVDTYTQAFKLLNEGKYDAVLSQELMGLILLKELKIKNVYRSNIEVDGFTQDFSFAVKEGDKELLSTLNEGLAIVMNNGVYDKLHKKWFSNIIKIKINYQKIITIFVSILTLMIFVFIFAYSVLLKKQVLIKTNHLKKEIEEHNKTQEGLKKKSKELEIANKKLKEKMDELEKFNKILISRELKMVELKDKIKKLKAKRKK